MTIDKYSPKSRRYVQYKPKTKEPKEKIDIGAFIFTGAIVGIMICSAGYLLYEGYTGTQWFSKQIDFLDALDWAPENATVTYSMTHAKPNHGDWINLFIWIEYEDEPWNNQRGYIWYTKSGEWYFEEYLESD